MHYWRRLDVLRRRQEFIDTNNRYPFFCKLPSCISPPRFANDEHRSKCCFIGFPSLNMWHVTTLIWYWFLCFPILLYSVTCPTTNCNVTDVWIMERKPFCVSACLPHPLLSQCYPQYPNSPETQLPPIVDFGRRVPGKAPIMLSAFATRDNTSFRQSIGTSISIQNASTTIAIHVTSDVFDQELD